MSIIELIQKAGEENVKVQGVAPSLVQMKRKKHDAEITLCTSHEMASSVSREAAGIEGTHVGMIVWIPRSKL